MSQVHVVLPNDVDDPRTPSGGNVYDRRICRGLGAAGWSVREHPVWGDWPHPSGPQRAELGRTLAGLPDDSLVLIDGLVASTVPEVLVPQASRLRLVVLVHMAVGGQSEQLRRRERDVLAVAVSIIATSRWSREHLLSLYALPPERVHVAQPGVDPAPLTDGSASGGRLLCVGSVAAHKGYDVLVQALAALAPNPWSCACVGSVERDPAFVEQLRQLAREYGIADRMCLVGPAVDGALQARYAATDLLVLPSRGETYGMVVTEALARGIPVLASDVGGLPEALGRAPDGSQPGLLVPPGDPAAIAAALYRWLSDDVLRRELRRCARARRATLTGWDITCMHISGALSGMPTNVSLT
jgi:glycosyltransferase involved in cell wall biosynthesis